MKDESLSSELWKYTKKQLRALRTWLRPVTEDPLYLKITKGILKAFVLLIFTILSPVYLVILIIAFFAAF